MFKVTYYCQLMYLRTFEIYVSWIIWALSCSFSAPELIWQAAFKKSKVKVDLLNDIDMLLMVEKGIKKMVIGMQKLIINTWKIMMKIKNCHIFHIGM